MGLGVLKLHCLDPTEIVKVPGVLIVGNVLREGGLDDKLPGLLIQILAQVRSQDDICDSCLSDQVFSQTSCLIESNIKDLT